MSAAAAAARFITDKRFETLVAKTKDADIKTLKWRDLPLDKIYKIEERKEVIANAAPAMILSLVDREGIHCKIWAPNRLHDRLNTISIERSIYIKSKGVKEYKTDAEKWYYDYEIIEIE